MEEKFLSVINEKDTEIVVLTNKINDLDVNIEKYEANLLNIRENYDNTIYEYQLEIKRKNDDIRYMMDAHAKEIKEVNFFIQAFLI